MFVFLMSVGIAGTLASVFALGFGFSNNGFDLGNTLIIAGAAGLGTSLVVIGLASALRELRRIADALGPRVVGRGVRPSEPAEAQVSAPRGGVSPRISYPPKPEPKPDFKPVIEPPAREPRPFEPQLPGMAEIGSEERPRSDIFAAARQAGEPPMVEEPDVTLPPAMRPPVAPPHPAAPAVRSPTGEPAYAPKFGPADILARLGGGRAPQRPRVETPQVDMPPPRAPAAAERPPEMWSPEEIPEPALERTPERAVEPPPLRTEAPPSGNMFESVWPTGGRSARAAGSDSIARAPKSEPKPEPKPDAKFEPKFESKSEPKSESKSEPKSEARFEPKRTRFEPPPLRSEPPPLRTETPAPRPETRVEPPAIAEPAAAAAPRPPVSILKSGVIDGMAYTLYTDGSIEAQLPQGTMHFASIEDLRLHLERHG